MQSLDKLFSGIQNVGNDIASVRDVGEAVPVLKTLNGVFGNSSSFLTLGSFDFQDLELPEVINFGTKQSHNKHMLPGGGRVFDLMGSQSDAITWSGIFLGADAESRRAELDALFRESDIYDLMWGELHKKIFIAELNFEYKTRFHIVYHITCEEVDVVPESSQKEMGFLESLTKDIGDALGVDLPAQLKHVNDAVKQVKPLIGTVASITGNSKLGRDLNGIVNTAETLSSGALNTSRGQVQGVKQILRTLNTPAKATNAIATLATGLNNTTKLGVVNNKMSAVRNDLNSLQPNAPRR